MKKTFLLLSFLTFSVSFCQETEKPPQTTTTTTTTISTTVKSETDKPSIFTKRHEVKIGSIKMLAGPVFEGTYEYIYSKDFTFGSSVQVSFINNDNYYEQFSITPFARFYFQETKEYGAKGFFFEGFAKYFTGKYVPNSLNNNFGFYSGPAQKYNSAAIGISLGKKWINRSGFVLELLFGYGRTIGSDKNQPPGVLRGDLNIGYRF